MKFNTVVLGVVLVGLMTAGSYAQGQDVKQDKAHKGAVKEQKVAAKDAAKDQKVKNPDNDKNKGKHKGETKGKHLAKGKSH